MPTPDDFKYHQNYTDLDNDLESVMDSQVGGSSSEEEDSPGFDDSADDSGLARIVQGDLPSTDVERIVAQSTPSVDQALQEQDVHTMLRERRIKDLAGRAAVHNFLQTAR